MSFYSQYRGWIQRSGEGEVVTKNFGEGFKKKNGVEYVLFSLSNALLRPLSIVIKLGGGGLSLRVNFGKHGIWGLVVGINVGEWGEGIWARVDRWQSEGEINLSMFRLRIARV